MIKFFYLPFLLLFSVSFVQASSLAEFEQPFGDIVTAYQPQQGMDLFHQEVCAREVYRRSDGTTFRFTLTIYPNAEFQDEATPALPLEATGVVGAITDVLVKGDLTKLSPEEEEDLGTFATLTILKVPKYLLDDSVKQAAQRGSIVDKRVREEKSSAERTVFESWSTGAFIEQFVFKAQNNVVGTSKAVVVSIEGLADPEEEGSKPPFVSKKKRLIREDVRIFSSEEVRANQFDFFEGFDEVMIALQSFIVLTTSTWTEGLARVSESNGRR